MESYENSIVGNIVLVRNLVFYNNVNRKYELDHAYKTGRPCLVIYSDDEYDYFLHLITGNDSFKYYNYKYFFINHKTDLLYEYTTPRKPTSYVYLRKIYKTPIAWRRNLSKIKFDVYSQIIEEIKKTYHKENLSEIVNTYSLMKKL